MGIEEARETIRSCRYCFLCRYACPTFLASKLESVTPRGYALLLMEVDESRQDWTTEKAARFYDCSQCGLCRQICEYHWPEDELVRHAREAIVASGHAPEAVIRLATGFMERSEPPPGLAGGQSHVPERKPRLLYFAGCQTLQDHPEIVEANQKLLTACGEDWGMLDEETCCGAPLYDLGYTREAQQAAGRLAERIEKWNPEILLTNCPHCLRSFQEHYPAWQVDLPPGIKIMHTSQYFQARLSDDSLKLKPNADFRHVAYHDACQLGRKMGVYNEPRELIASATGSPPLELYHAREQAECCGAGSVMGLTNPDLAGKIATLRLERAIEAGAETLVSACPNCKSAFTLGNNQLHANLRLLDLSELLLNQIE